MRTAQKVAAIVFIGFVGLVAGVKCNPIAKLFDAGPFSGQVIDAESGKPISRAFVGFNWDGSSWIAGHSRVLSVLVQTDDEGRYQVPWQGVKLDASDMHSIVWDEGVWAPGYVLLQIGEKTQSSSARDVKIRLTRATSAVNALEKGHRPDPTSYCCKEDTQWDKKSVRRDAQREANRAARKALELALYRDSYHRICVEEVPNEALTSVYLELPRGDLSAYQFDYDRPAYDARVNGSLNEEWRAFDQKTESVRSKNAAPWDRALISELCTLGRYEPALSGAPP